MFWKMETGRNAPAAAVRIAEEAAREFDVPVGILLGTVECETDFRLGLVSSAGAVGPCQFLPRYAQDYYRYAGFEFDLAGWDAIRGMAAVYRFYAKLGADRHGHTGADGWRYALLSHRYGQNSRQARELDCTTDRIRDVESMMRRNGVWYDNDAPDRPDAEDKPDAGKHARVARAAAQWAEDKVGCRYSQAERTREGVFDCSSLVARAYAAQGLDWALVGSKVPNSTQEVYSDQFELLWPESYDRIGKTMGGASVLRRADQPGDLQFLCTDKSTGRSNKITHVTLVLDRETIVHARSTRYGVRKDDIDLYAGKVCALLRYNPDAPLRRGMKGLRVRVLQEALNRRGARIEADGNYGPATERAVERYEEEE